jgi:hypothetical protein
MWNTTFIQPTRTRNWNICFVSQIRHYFFSAAQNLKRHINLKRPRQLPTRTSARNYRKQNADSRLLLGKETNHQLQLYMCNVLWRCDWMSLHLLRKIIFKTRKILSTGRDILAHAHFKISQAKSYCIFKVALIIPQPLHLCTSFAPF